MRGLMMAVAVLAALMLSTAAHAEQMQPSRLVFGSTYVVKSSVGWDGQMVLSFSVSCPDGSMGEFSLSNSVPMRILHYKVGEYDLRLQAQFSKGILAESYMVQMRGKYMDIGTGKMVPIYGSMMLQEF